MSDLLDSALERARESVNDLDGPEDDVMPILMWTGPYGVGMMPLLNMANDAAKDDMAGMMTTVLAVSRATEAVMTTTSWVVVAPPGSGTEHGWTGPPPSQHPDRKECVTVMYHTAEGTDSMSRGLLERFPDKPPTMGEWDTWKSDETIRIGGRFGDAIRMAFDFTNGMPPELVEIIDAGWAADQQEDLIQRFHKVFTGFFAAMEAGLGDMQAPDAGS